jgi:4-diphosphocytidyl-2-C-methyl-D-erythritol kinase
VSGVEPAARLTLRKDIPVGGGLAGGSADAAAALVAADALWGANLSQRDLERLAAGLGSDVAFLLHGGTALGTGHGEVVSPVLSRGEWHWVLAVAEAGLSTPTVYAELDKQRGGDQPESASVADGVLAALRAGDPVALGLAMRNDLQAPALQLRPNLARSSMRDASSAPPAASCRARARPSHCWRGRPGTPYESLPRSPATTSAARSGEQPAPPPALGSSDPRRKRDRVFSGELGADAFR